jgi:RHS repeat-associated protein
MVGGAHRLRAAAALAVCSIAVSPVPASAAAAARPDLLVTSVAAPATVSANGVLAVTDTVRNAGKGAAGKSSVAFFLSRDRRAGGDVKLGLSSVARLGARLSATAEVELALPRSIGPGTFYVVACADAARKVVESKESNNCTVARKAVKVVKPRADLAVSATASVPATLRADRAGSMVVTVRNRGGKPSAAAMLEVLLSHDRMRDTGDTLAGSRAVPGLAARVKLARAVTLTVPYSLTSGSYIVLACLGTSCRVMSSTSVVDVAIHAPPTPADAPTDFASSVAFLYSGAASSQQGVTPGAVDANRVAVLRGRVVDRADHAVAGVKVTALGHPELGFTRTRPDGMFDLAVNGGGQIDVDYRVDGYLPVQRSETAPWRDFATVPDVVLTTLDSAVTTVTSGSADWQVHRGNPVTDGDGTRRATLLFAPGTHASLRMADGSLVAAPTISVRATEFTSGANGPDAMPGALPATSGYTYAIEYSADEAISAGAVGVTFDQPVITYTEDFVGFPIGTAVPAGSYNAVAGRWEANPNGVVVRVVSSPGGVAQLDVDGDGVVDTGAKLDALGITAAELAQLGAIYTTPANLMRVATTHFSSADLNWPYGPPAGAAAPDGASAQGDDTPGSTCRDGSIVICESQTLVERIPVTGTPYSLVYGSDRVPGRLASRTLRLRLRPATLTLEPTAIHVVIRVAGQTVSQTFPPSTLTWNYTWDGRDAYGRPVLGWVPAMVDVGYEYDGQYYDSRAATAKAFGAFSGVTFTQGPPPPVTRRRRPLATGTVVTGRSPVIIWRTFQASLGTWDARGLGLGGWTLDPVETYDRDSGVLQNGDGTAERADQSAYDALAPIAGNGLFNGPIGDGGQATAARLASPDGVAVAPDGTIYVADTVNDRLRKIAVDGTISTVYGDGGCCRPADVAVGHDGSAYVADTIKRQIIRVAPDGTTTVIAGTGTAGYSGDGGPATAAQLNTPNAIAVGPDDSVWFADSWPVLPGDVRIRRIAPDGTISTEIGGGPAPAPANPFGDGLPASQVRIAFLTGNGITVGPDGTVYVVDSVSAGPFIRAIGPDGISHRFAGAGSPPIGTVGDGGPASNATLYQLKAVAAGPDGSVYIGEGTRIRKVAPDGTISTLAGGNTAGYAGDGGPGGAGQVNGVFALTVAPDGEIVFADHGNSRIRAIRSVLKGVPVGALSLASADGSEVYRFDAAGRHTETRDGLTGTLTLRLGHDAAGRITTLTDRHGLVTTVERDASGNPTAIVAPGGQRTTLTTDANGFLASISDPLHNATQLTYSGTGGLLAGATDPRGNKHDFGYDALGLLESDHDPAGGTQTLTRTDLGTGVDVTDTTALGRQTTYHFDRALDGSITWRQTAPGGAVTTTIERPDGTVRIATPDGRVEDLTTGPDPRFGQRVAVITKDVVTEPSAGPVSTTTATRTMTTASGGGIATLSDDVVVNGQHWTYAYAAASGTITATSPEGRTATATLNDHDDVTSYQRGSLTPTTFTYDGRGRLTRLSQGTVHSDFAYDSGDRLVSVADSLGHATTLVDDADGRPTSVTRPSGAVFGLHRDASGNIDGVDLPGPSAPRHAITNDPLDRLSGYTAPGHSALALAYTPDREFSSTTEPDGGVIGYAYDAAGRPTTDTFPEGTATQAYSDATGRVASATRTPSSGTPQVSTYEHTGDLITRDDQTGPAAGDFRYTFSNDLDVAGWSLDGSASAVTRDNDRLVTGEGPWTRTIDGNGLVTGVAGSDPTDNVAYGYDALGRLTSRTVTVNGGQSHRLDVTYDAVGRVHTVALPGVRTYAYDVDGRLTGVTGAETSAYLYDARDNLTSGPSSTLAYGADDELLGTYTYDANGRLATHGADTFTYSARGELLAANVNGNPVTYTYDAAGRRVSRSAGGVTTQYLYGSMDDPVQLTASKQNGVTTVYRYDALGFLVAIERGTDRYLVATDQVGSPVAAFDVLTGLAVVQRTYDAYGRLAPGGMDSLDLPIGYAGGLADSATSLVRFGLRDYDPAAGRFTAPDPLLFDGGQFNLYAYAGDDPVGRRDPFGLDSSNQSLPVPRTCGPSEPERRREWSVLRWQLQQLRKSGPGPYAPFTRQERALSDQAASVDPGVTSSDGKPTSAAAFSSSGAATKA